MNREPYTDLPDWARAYFDRCRARFDDPGKLPHRRDAFYRLFCTKNGDMRRMWERADRIVVIDQQARPIPQDGRGFLSSLIYGTDDAVENEQVPKYPRPASTQPARRLRPEQTAARKVAHLLQLLFHVTPRDCYARHHGSHFGTDVEWLVVHFGFILGPFDYSAMHRVYKITYTCTSQRGWVQHRRAHDLIRRQLIDAIRMLEQRTADPTHALIVRMREIAEDLATWPDMDDEHGHQIERLSNKSGWQGWLRYAYDQMLGDIESGDLRDNLRHCDWAALAAALYCIADNDRNPAPGGTRLVTWSQGDITEARISEIVREVERTRNERLQVEAERYLARRDAIIQATSGRKS